MLLDGLSNLWDLLMSQVIALEPTNLLAQLYNILYNVLLLFVTFSS
ncbi:MAG TPA: hypothetical protein PKY01_12590 [Candidatus Hydrogenedentes bacterium]|nr:hypothetical protein [Candidatus Hydrogenedentota bacterium]HQH53257.1 hypothetical protein [Candidatus Hydrogenedentota bacterium]HQM47846.1 hypothetical protein [Candidatus Hydrogenedentota bacterium]